MSVGLVAALLPVGLRIGLVDLPDQDLKTHGRRVPIVGGIAVFITVNFVLAIADRFDLGFFAVGLAMLILGHYDDIKGLSPGVRIMAAAIAGGLLAVVSGLPFSVSLYIASVIVVVVAVNSVNLLDGADGVAGSAAIGTSFGIAILANGRGLDPVPSLILGSALCGFLVFNWPRARAFLGDGGAYLVGISLTFLMLHSTSPPESQASESWYLELAIAFSMFGVFILDLAVTLVRRVRARQPLMKGDRSHLYDQLASRGWSAGGIASTVGIAQAGIVIAVVIADRTLNPISAMGVILGVYVAIIGLLGVAGFVSVDGTVA